MSRGGSKHSAFWFNFTLLRVTRVSHTVVHSRWRNLIQSNLFRKNLQSFTDRFEIKSCRASADEIPSVTSVVPAKRLLLAIVASADSGTASASDTTILRRDFLYKFKYWIDCRLARQDVSRKFCWQSRRLYSVHLGLWPASAEHFLYITLCRKTYSISSI